MPPKNAVPKLKESKVDLDQVYAEGKSHLTEGICWWDASGTWQKVGMSGRKTDWVNRISLFTVSHPIITQAVTQPMKVTPLLDQKWVRCAFHSHVTRSRLIFIWINVAVCVGSLTLHFHFTFSTIHYMWIGAPNVSSNMRVKLLCVLQRLHLCAWGCHMSESQADRFPINFIFIWDRRHGLRRLMAAYGIKVFTLAVIDKRIHKPAGSACWMRHGVDCRSTKRRCMHKHVRGWLHDRVLKSFCRLPKGPGQSVTTNASVCGRVFVSQCK